jgi:hypothetical protein
MPASPTPRKPPPPKRSATSSAPRHRSASRLSPQLAALFAQLDAMADSERMTQLVDYLDDLRREFDWAAELKAMGFCAPICAFQSSAVP